MKADSAALKRDGSDTNTGQFVGGKSDYTDITTALVSLRLSPTDDDDRLVTPYRLVQDLKDAWAEARPNLPTNDDLIAYFWAIAGTDTWATPHVHCYLWYTDPNDDVHRDDFRPVVESFVKAATFPADAHIDDDGGLVNGVARVEHEPLLADPEALHTRLDDDAFADVVNQSTGPKRLTHGDDAQSQGAIYVGSQLPKLALAGAESDAETEAAVFVDVASDGRHTARGGGDFNFLANALDALSDHETPVIT